jgi:hypothetical protein
MRSLLIAAAALVAVAAPGVAAAQTGYVGAVFANTEVDGFDDSDAYGIEGAVAFDGSNGISFEIDAALLDSDDSDAVTAIAGHIFSRNDRYLFGGFVGLTDGDDSTTVEVGVEANKYFDRWTLAGAVSYGDNDDANTDGFGANVQARFFPHDNLRLQVNAGWASVDTPGGDADGFTYGVGAEYQFASVPISVGANYARVDFDDNGVEADTLGVTVRYNWGGTLFDRDRRGASQAGLGIGSLLRY